MFDPLSNIGPKGSYNFNWQTPFHHPCLYVTSYSIPGLHLQQVGYADCRLIWENILKASTTSRSITSVLQNLKNRNIFL